MADVGEAYGEVYYGPKTQQETRQEENALLQRLRAEKDNLIHAVRHLHEAQLCTKDAEGFLGEAKLQRVGFFHVDAGGLCVDLHDRLESMVNRLVEKRWLVHDEINVYSGFSADHH